MKSKNLLVSFLAIVSILCLVVTVSACDYFTYKGDLASVDKVQVNGINIYAEGEVYEDIAVTAGETITVKVYFTADEYDSDVTVEAEIEGEKVDTKASTESFDVTKDSRVRVLCL